MLALRKRVTQGSIFRFAQQFSPVAGVQTITFSAGTAEPGDTIFLNHRSSTGTASSTTGWTVIGNVSGLLSMARVVKPGETSWTYTIPGGSNHNCQCMVVAGTLGYIDATLYEYATAPTPLPAIAIQKNSVILIYFTTVGAINATSRTLTPSDFTIALNAGFNLQSVYKQYFEPITEGFTLTWGGGVPANTRITRVQILGAT